MSKIYRKAINKFSSSDRSNDSDSESVGSKPKRSLSFRRRSSEEKKKASKSSRSSLEGSSSTSADLGKPQMASHDEEAANPVLTPMDVTVEMAPSNNYAPEAPQTELVEQNPNEGAIASETAKKTCDTNDQNKSTPENNSSATSVNGPPSNSSVVGTKSPLSSPILAEIAEDLEPLLERTLSQQTRIESVDAPASLWWSVFSGFKGLVLYLDPRDPKLVHLIIILLMGLGLLGYFVFSNLDLIIGQSVEFDIQSISVTKINSDGVDSHVVATVYVDYDKVSNFLYRNVVKIGGFIVGGVTISPVKPVRLYAKPSDLNIAPLHLADIRPPPFIINVMNRGISDVYFISKVSVFKQDFVKLAHEIQNIKSSDISLDVQGVVNSNIDSSLFHLHGNEINFLETVKVAKDDYIPDIKVTKFETISAGEAINIQAEIVLIPKQEELPFEFSVQGINWDVLVYDCEKELVKLGDWKSKPFNVDRSSELLVPVEGLIDTIDERLTTKCPDATKSPFNQILQHYLNGEPIDLVLRGSEKQDEKLPDWLYYVLKGVNYELEVKLPRQNAFLQSLEVDSVDLEIQPGSQDNFNAILSSNITVSFPYDLGTKFQVPKFKSSFAIKNSEGDDIIQGLSPSYNQMQVTISNNTLSLDLSFNNLAISVRDAVSVGKLVEKAISEDYDTVLGDIFVDVDLQEVHFESGLFNSRISELSLKNLTIPRKPKPQFMSQLGFKKEDVLKANFDLDHLDVTIQDILYVESSINGITFLCDYEIYNPTNYSVDLPGQSISFSIQYHGTSLGKITLSDVYVPRRQRFNSTVTVQVLASDLEEKLCLEQFLSALISQEPLEVTVANISAGSNAALDLLLQQITVPHINIPPVKFAIPETKDTSEKNPFIVESTIHVLSSDAELKVFNPVSNAEIIVELYQAQASNDGVDLGYTKRSELLLVTPGVYQTPKMPIKTNPGIGNDILRKAINGNLEVDIIAVLKARLDRFDARVICRSKGLIAQIRL